MNARQALLESVLDLRSFLLKGACSGVHVKQKERVSVNIKKDLQEEPAVFHENLSFHSEKKQETVINSFQPDGDFWEDLKTKCLQCTRCRLSQTRKKVVFGSGDPHSILWVVGEAPGGDEDLKGEPFVGKAGQLLTKMLSAIGVDRETIFITNILKCRPPDNRNPHPDEIECCAPYLENQLTLMTPKVILTLGKFSTSFILQSDLGIMKLRGKSYERSGIILVPTFHPSALLRNPAWKYDAWEDLKTLKEILISLSFYKKQGDS